MNNGNKKIILLVEDEAIIAMTEKMELEKYGYSVHHVATGEKAVKTILEEIFPIELILMDIDLGPGIDGTQAAEQILNHKDIPVVFLSSHIEPEVVEKTEKISSYGYVVKNSGIVVLDASIKMALKLFNAKIERKQAEENVSLSEENYRFVFLNMNSYNSLYEVVMDNEGRPYDFRFIMVNYAYEEYVGKKASELIGKTLLEVYPKTEQYWIDKMAEAALTGMPVHFRNFSREMNTYTEINLYTPKKGQLAMTTANITERKQAEMKMRAEEENLRITLNSIGDAVISTDNQGRVVRMNPVAEMLCGWKESEAYGKKLEEVFCIVNGVTRQRIDTPLESVMRTGTVVGLANHTLLLSKDGKEWQIADSAAPIITTGGDITGVVLVFRDVTEQYEKDRQLKERLKELNCFYKMAEIVEKPDIALKDILQETAELIPQSWQHPEICEACITLHGQTFQTANFTFTNWYLSSDLIVNGIVSGEVTICYHEEKPSRDEGPFLTEERKLLDVVAERLGRIIERKQLEENLHSIEWMLSGKEQNEKKYTPEYGDLTELNENGLILSSLGKDQLIQISLEYLDLLETSSAVYEKNGDYSLGMFSSGWCQLLDAASRKLCRTDNNKEALSCGKWLCHESCWRDASMKSIESGRPVDVECVGGLRLYAIPVRADGEIIGAINFGYGNPPKDDIKLQKLSDLYQIPIEVLRKKRDEYQTRPQFIIDYAKKRIENSAKLIENLVERKQAEVDRRESLKRLEFALQAGKLGMWDWNPQTGAVVYSDLWAQMLEYRLDEVEPTVEFFKQRIHPDDLVAVLDRLTGHVEGRLPVYKSEHRIRTKSGRWLWVLDLGKIAEWDKDGRPVRVTGLIADITDRMQLEIELAETAERFKALHNASFGGIAIHDNGIILECNQGLSEMTGYSLSELIGMNGLLLIAPEHREMVKNKIATGYEKPYEANGLTKNGDIFPMVLEARNVPYKGKNVRTVEFRDITERKQAEEEIKKQLIEKETLLREVHHRVKNNIGNIESFLALQNDSIDNPEAKSVIKDAISRVQSIRILYDKLLVSKDLHEVSIKNYIENLIDSLHEVFADQDNIFIEATISDFNIKSKEAITIGIIINELLTNAFKYAFKDRAKGAVTVSIEKIGKMVTVIIQDNGIGIDERISENKSPGFGLTIVKMLVEQLKGTHSMVNNNGTKSVIQFEI